MKVPTAGFHMTPKIELRGLRNVMDRGLNMYFFNTIAFSLTAAKEGFIVVLYFIPYLHTTRNESKSTERE